MNTVSSASITGMVVSLILCVAVPVALCILLKRKTAAKLSDMLLGAVTFVIFAMFLEQMLHLAMSAVFGEKLTGNLWLSALYGGAAAAVFEEFGRLVAMKYFLGSQLEKENALMYGVGHGGVEALFVGGLTCVSNLATVSMVNGGKLESALAGLDILLLFCHFRHLRVPCPGSASAFHVRIVDAYAPGYYAAQKFFEKFRRRV